MDSVPRKLHRRALTILEHAEDDNRGKDREADYCRLLTNEDAE